MESRGQLSSCGTGRARTCLALETWTTGLRSLEELPGRLGGEVLLDEVLKHQGSSVVDLPNCLMLVSLRRPSGTMPTVTLEVCSSDRSVARLQLAHVQELLPEVGRLLLVPPRCPTDGG